MRVQLSVSLFLEAMISWKEFQACMPWEVALLVGGGFALAEGTQVPYCLKSLHSSHIIINVSRKLVTPVLKIFHAKAIYLTLIYQAS